MPYIAILQRCSQAKIIEEIPSSTRDPVSIVSREIIDKTSKCKQNFSAFLFSVSYLKHHTYENPGHDVVDP